MDSETVVTNPVYCEACNSTVIEETNSIPHKEQCISSTILSSMVPSRLLKDRPSTQFPYSLISLVLFSITDILLQSVLTFR